VAVAGDGRVDDPRVDRGHVAVAQAHPVEHARTEVLEEHVDMTDEPPDDLDTLRPREIERQVPLPDVLLDVVRRQRVLAHRREARQVAFGGLDLDDVRAQVVEQAGAVRSGEHP
jgi:hypothetical protein